MPHEAEVKGHVRRLEVELKAAVAASRLQETGKIKVTGALVPFLQKPQLLVVTK